MGLSQPSSPTWVVALLLPAVRHCASLEEFFLPFDSSIAQSLFLLRLSYCVALGCSCLLRGEENELDDVFSLFWSP